LFAGFDGLAAHHPPEPHWYLVFVGIEPAAQRSRFGNQLLAPVLGRADAEHLICYLETPFEQTIEFYRRLGFTVTSKSEPFAAPTPIWTMVRAPSASSQQPRDSLPP
jgi:ribosomal protein S18 acetylase RimI-like enzyme